MIDDDAMDEFILECQEINEKFIEDLSIFEKRKDDHDLIDSLYRSIHTIKGSCHLFGFKHLGHLSHTMEAALDAVRKKIIVLDGFLTDRLLIAADILSKQFIIIKSKNKDEPIQDILDQLIPSIVFSTVRSIDKISYNIKDNLYDYRSCYESHKIKISPAIRPQEQKNKNIDIKSVKENSMEKIESSSIEDKSEKKEKKEEIKTDQNAQDSGTIRVPISLLDALMSHIGELVLVRNQVLQYAEKSKDNHFQSLSQRLNLISSELQNDVMKTRMQPIGNILTKFTRVVRDLSKQLSKKIDLFIQGAETELDKSLIEAIKDPLTHIIRNCIDHGIEEPAERLKNKKAETGKINLNAYHEGGQVIIEIKDDGKGLSRNKIAAKAIEKNLYTKEQIEMMSDTLVHKIIFAPGFSTAAKVSDISGRGVGMDVVKTNVEQIGGIVDLSSEEGKGMTLTIKIPLTLAIVPALIIKCEKERYAIPQVKVIELIAMSESNGVKDISIQMLQGIPIMRLRGKILPLISLRKTLLMDELALNNFDQKIVILNADGKHFGLIVDAIEDSADIVVKPMPSFLKKITSYSGSTILGDGSVILILDVMGLSKDIEIRKSDLEKEVSIESKELAAYEKMQGSDYLIISIKDKKNFAIPLCLVSRLEEFNTEKIEHSSSQFLIQYREDILPLISLSENLFLEKDNLKNITPAIVIKKSDKNFGLIVSDILDVKRIDHDIDYSLEKDFIIGSVIDEEEIIHVIDAYKVIDHYLKKDLAQNEVRTKNKKNKIEKKNKTILVVDDHNFFRNQVSSILERDGYDTLKSCDGKDAIQMIQSKKHKIDMIITDIEMPVMSGPELLKNCQMDNKIAQIPILALTSKYNEKEKENGINLGFKFYLEKINAEEVIYCVHQTLGD